MLHTSIISPGATSMPETAPPRREELCSRLTTASLHMCPYDDCDKKCRRRTGLTRHLSTHTRGPDRVCPHQDCGRAFTRHAGLTYHLRAVHTKEKPFICPLPDCGHSFTGSGNLTIHLRTHSGQKPFICPHGNCGHSFISSGYLKNHLRVHSEKRAFACPHEGCKYAFKQPSGLKYHLQAAHTRERPFVCPHTGCGYRTVQSRVLAMHMRIHSGEKPHRCPHEHCGFSSAQSSNLKRHLRLHSAGKLFTTRTWTQPADKRAGVCADEKDDNRDKYKHPGSSPVRPHIDESHYRCASATPERSFRLKSLLKTHLHGHTGTRPGRCPDGDGERQVTEYKMRKPQGRVRTGVGTAAHSAHGAAASPANSCHNPTSHYCSVITWVSGGIVYKHQEKQKPGRVNLWRKIASRPLL